MKNIKENGNMKKGTNSHESPLLSSIAPEKKKAKKSYNKLDIKHIEIEQFITICATSVVETCSIVQSTGQEIGEDFDFADNTTFNQTWE